MTSNCKLRNDSEIIRWSAHYKIVEDMTLMILFVESDGEISYDAYFVLIGFLLSILSLVDDAVEPLD